MKAVILSLGVFAAVGPAVADDEAPIKIDQLPKVVRSAVKAKFPKAELVRASKEEEDDGEVYEVALKDGGAEIDVTVSAKGKVLEVERTIAADKLPAAVSAAVKAEHPNAKIAKAEEVVEYDEDEDDEEEKYFEVELSIEGKPNVELKISPKGKVLDDEASEGHDEGTKGKDRKAEKDDD